MKNIRTVQGTTTLTTYSQKQNTRQPVPSTRRAWLYAILALMAGYAVRMMVSASAISVQERNVVLAAIALALMMGIPIIALNIYFAARRSASETTATHSPRSSQRVKQEAAAWVIPLVIVAVVISAGWGMLHSLDLYQPMKHPVSTEINRAGAGAGVVQPIMLPAE